MSMNAFNDFVFFSEFNYNTINDYHSKIPVELHEIWKKYGEGCFLDGYFKVINPDDYAKLINESYFRGKYAIPILVTALAEIITWEEGEFIGKIDYPHGVFHLIGKKFTHFLSNLEDQDFLDEYFNQVTYKKAISQLGKLSYDECFGHIPLLSLGGKDSVDSLQRCKVLEHIQLITNVTGKIGDN